MTAQELTERIGALLTQYEEEAGEAPIGCFIHNPQSGITVEWDGEGFVSIAPRVLMKVITKTA